MSFDKVNLDQENLAKLQSIATFYSSVESALSIQTDCREKFLAITNLEQSYMWLLRMLEREQIEKNLKLLQTQQASTTVGSTPIPSAVASQAQQQTQPKLSPDAVILAESRTQIDRLQSAIKDLTNTIAVTGIKL